MPTASADTWPELIGSTLRSYDDSLLRKVAGKLCKPRNQWPVAELISRSQEVLANPAQIDRRLKDLDPAARQLLAVIGHSRQPRWPVGSLVEIMTMLGHHDGLAPVRMLLETGLLFPVLATKSRLKQLDIWLGQGGPVVVALPSVTQRALHEPLPLECPDPMNLRGPAQEADGLDWPLRLAVFWQQLSAGPMRRTQQRDLFKRDLDRLRMDPILGAGPTDALAEIPDPGLLTAAWALASGLMADDDGELRSSTFSDSWHGSLFKLLGDLMAALPRIESWNAAGGWQPATGDANPFASAHLISLLLLASLPKGSFASPQAIETWIDKQHPFWKNAPPPPSPSRGADRQADTSPSSGIGRFLLGVAYPLKLVEATKTPEEEWAVRLSALGSWLLGFGEEPPAPPAFAQTLLVQPNLEVLVYRQGMTPELIVKLTRVATWKTLGSACTLQLEPGSVYRALELGESQSSLVQTLERHSMKPLPPAVLEALRTWSDKRDRLTVYPSAVLLEFSTPADLNEALARGLPAVRLTERLAVVPSESQIDYKQFRLTGTRDYLLPPEPCVDVESDGVTLSVDLARSDLLLETELQRFAEPISDDGAAGRKSYRLTPASLTAARGQGLSLNALAEWFSQRTGMPLAPAVRLVFAGSELPPASLGRRLVLEVPGPETADGLLQWPATATLISGRLGPTALVVDEAKMPLLLERLREIGLHLVHEDR